MFGYTVNKDKEFVILEKEGDIVRRIFEDYQTKIITDIAKDLVLEGLLPNATVNSAATLVRSVLHRELYYGKEVVINGYKRRYPPIISKAEFDEAAKKLHDRKKYCKTKSKHSYLCRGIVYNINNEPLKPLFCHDSYAFVKVHKFNWETLSINMTLLDSIALYYTLENKKRKPGKDLMKYKVELQQELKVLSKKVSTIDKKLSDENDKIMKFEMRYASGKMTETMLDLLVGKVQEEIKRLEADRNDLEAEGDDLKKRLNNLSDSGKLPLLGPLSEADKERIVHEEISKITVVRGKARFGYVLGIQYFNGDYVMVDMNSKSKKVWDEAGNIVEYKNLQQL